MRQASAAKSTSSLKNNYYISAYLILHRRNTKTIDKWVNSVVLLLYSISHASKEVAPGETGVVIPTLHTYTWRKEMAFLTSTLMVETGLWDALKTRTQKFGKSFMQGCIRYGEARARSEMKRLGII